MVVASVLDLYGPVGMAGKRGTMAMMRITKTNTTMPEELIPMTRPVFQTCRTTAELIRMTMLRRVFQTCMAPMGMGGKRGTMETMRILKPTRTMTAELIFHEEDELDVSELYGPSGDIATISINPKEVTAPRSNQDLGCRVQYKVYCVHCAVYSLQCNKCSL